MHVFEKSNTGQDSLPYGAPETWNRLHSDVKPAKNVKGFKVDIQKKNYLKTPTVKKTIPICIFENPKTAKRNIC